MERGRLRRLRGLKQQAIADLAGVCQTTVSRWESGLVVPQASLGERVLRMLECGSGLSADSGLRRLVETASAAVHLVTDTDHLLLAASAAREREWGRSLADLRDVSLWRFASPSIERAERRLEDSGWWRGPQHSPVIVELDEADTDVRIAAGRMLWERLELGDGTPVQLCSML